MKNWVLGQMRRRGRVYILPTKMGGYLNSLVFLMFLLAIGYNNNLLLIFALFFFGLNLTWVIQTHFHLRGLELESLVISDGHAGTAIPFCIHWKKTPSEEKDWQLVLLDQNRSYSLKCMSTRPFQARGEIELSQRGKCIWKYLLVSTERPFGLYRAWRYFTVNSFNFVYPSLIKEGILPSMEGVAHDGEVSTGQLGEGGDFDSLISYSEQETRRISWKHYAKSGELWVKATENQRAPMAILKWRPEEHKGKEEALSELATHMVLCHRHAIPFYFVTGIRTKGPALHRQHLAECLRELSQC